MTKNEKDVERPYVVDGIKEYDNPLPSWWVALFWGTIAFAVVYLAYIHGMGGPTLEDELYADRDAYEATMEKQASAKSPAGEDLIAQLKSDAMIAEGKTHYVTNCAPCHGQNGEGLVGPNLTDVFWLHGGSPEDIIKVITDGVPAKGMIAWKTILGPKKIKETTAFILSLQGTNPANPKAPQGEKYEGS
ncbi:cbb3-type cytochrome c oxidase N-terminal domain-containing protein [Pseudobacteriovorax antillogorgiicola]|uniref:Cytochrome c oxidase, cbb3-type, subunit III n=1 Tax=Pseudobacteriovorax antillogorgiicola TaxID=1513793 RepID=A0A1Y6BDH2_9BACT|nr:cbb3-type cytochrome c oxidase N-terminal domain-containing protein [Pseudobacteriovorax antillogorgiicola]TCS56411.1 cbb3-type cytochrome c oxidase subunit III [Pseudobacteriovorax antillogorgiicola]SMF05837.1 cytochrome c oxidase, cbb3-type, subunit III [Pseudobacteriovorax antillogorgiicola]